ncbi:MAG: hypothetical protein HY343_00440 [Lentisphaerae bacterium]|nr:hypothetical protein [Lentisphaerota bacterium]
MNSVYTRTITDEARRRGIAVEVLERETPIFLLRHKGREVRCFNALTDRVGAASFHLAQDKFCANRFLAGYGFPVPRQLAFDGWSAAGQFLKKHRRVVVKPRREWGGRGVSVGLSTLPELRQAVRYARKYGEDILLEQYVDGLDRRVIVVNNRFVAAIERLPATVTGDGRSTVRRLIRRKNAAARKIDPSNRIPLDAETRRTLFAAGLTLAAVPKAGDVVQARFTSNFHTGGTIAEITETVEADLVKAALKVAKLLQIPVLGVDFILQPRTGKYWIIETSPDLAISPPEGRRVARFFLDYLFPNTGGRPA